MFSRFSYVNSNLLFLISEPTSYQPWKCEWGGGGGEITTTNATNLSAILLSTRTIKSSLTKLSDYFRIVFCSLRPLGLCTSVGIACEHDNQNNVCTYREAMQRTCCRWRIKMITISVRKYFSSVFYWSVGAVDYRLPPPPQLQALRGPTIIMGSRIVFCIPE